MSESKFASAGEGVGVPPLGIYDDRALTCVALVMSEMCCKAEETEYEGGGEPGI